MDLSNRNWTKFFRSPISSQKAEQRRPLLEPLEGRTLLSVSLPVQALWAFTPPNPQWDAAVQSGPARPKAAPAAPASDPLPAEGQPVIVLALDGARVNSFDTIDFGTSTAGQSVVKTLTITNGGTQPLSLQLAKLPPGFLLSDLPASLGPNASADVQLSLDTAHSGIYNDNLVIATNDPGAPAFNLHLTGRVMASGLAVSDINPLSFNGQLVSGGVKNFKQYVNVTLLNNSDAKIKGSKNFNLYASTNPIFNPASSFLIGKGKGSYNLAPQQSRNVKIQVRFPSLPDAADYYIFAVPTGKKVDPNIGGRSVNAIRIAMPFVRLENNRLEPPLSIDDYPVQMTWKLGKVNTYTLPLANTGNLPANGKADLDIIITRDGTLNEGQGFVLASIPNAKIKVNSGATQKIKMKIKLPSQLPLGFGPGNYFVAIKVNGKGELGQLNQLNGFSANEVPTTIV